MSIFWFRVLILKLKQIKELKKENFSHKRLDALLYREEEYIKKLDCPKNVTSNIENNPLWNYYLYLEQHFFKVCEEQKINIKNEMTYLNIKKVLTK